MFVLVSTILFTLFLFVLAIVIRNNPYSLLYKYKTFDRDKLVAEVLHKNERQFEEALTNLTLADQGKFTHSTDIKNDLVIGIITVSRSYKSKLLGKSA